MPEIPDLTVYAEAMAARMVGERPAAMRVPDAFILRSATPSPTELIGREVRNVRRLAKRLVIGFEGDAYIVIHLMIAGRLHWKEPAAVLPKRVGLFAMDFDHGSLTLTERAGKRRASIHLVSGADELTGFDPGGLDALDAPYDAFAGRVTTINRTLKRLLTDQRIIAGIGNAYSDEILHHARLSPMRRADSLGDDDWRRLHASINVVLERWIASLREECGNGFPEKVTAFREGMAVHGRYRQACPDCGQPIQRIRYATNECNYCASCQNQGRLLADRSLSRLLKKDWPRTLEELEGSS